jgi:hypothetical protein
MKILEKVLEYNDHWRPSEADFSASELASASLYQMWLSKNKVPKTHKIPLDKQIASKIGTGFHLLAEEALKNEPNIYTEVKMIENIGDYKVSGTPDVIYFEDDMWIVGDYKTKGTYQMKKAILQGVDEVKLQMSIYAYLWSKHKKVPMPLIGEVYLIHIGDTGWWSKKDIETLMLPEKSKVPKYFTATVDLYGADEVEKIVREKAQAIEAEPLVDCQDWQCDYCSFECEHRDKDVNDQF